MCMLIFIYSDYNTLQQKVAVAVEFMESCLLACGVTYSLR